MKLFWKGNQGLRFISSLGHGLCFHSKVEISSSLYLWLRLKPSKGRSVFLLEGGDWTFKKQSNGQDLF